MNIFGPDPARGGTTVRPPRSIAANADDHWFNTCVSASDPNATKLVADWFNDIIAEARTLARTAGVTDDEASDALVAESVARYVSRATLGTCTGSANSYTLTALGTTVVPKALFDGMEIEFTPNVTNTTASTLVAFGLASKAVRTWDDKALQGAELFAGYPAVCRYSAAAHSGAGAWLLRPWGNRNTLVRADSQMLRFDSGTVRTAGSFISPSPPVVYEKFLGGSTFSGGVLTVGANDAGLWMLHFYAAGASTDFKEMNARMDSSIKGTVGASANSTSASTATGGSLVTMSCVVDLVAAETVTFQYRQLLHTGTTDTIRLGIGAHRIGVKLS